MSLHQLTKSALNQTGNFSQEVKSSINTVVKLIEDYSAMSDVNFLLHKYNKSLPGIELPKGEARWLPIRNLARILAKISSIKTVEQIEKIYLESMNCGCDYFEGNVFVYINSQKLGGPYKWQWTAFADRERHFDKFTIFPELTNSIEV